VGLNLPQLAGPSDPDGRRRRAQHARATSASTRRSSVASLVATLLLGAAGCVAAGRLRAPGRTRWRYLTAEGRRHPVKFLDGACALTRC